MSRAINIPPMNVSVLQSALERLRAPDAGVVIQIEPGHTTVGGTPCVPILRVHAGFDWDSGKVFLNPGQRLGIVGDELIALRERTNDTNETLAWIRMQLRDKRLTPEQKIAEVRNTINAHAKKHGLPQLTN